MRRIINSTYISLDGVIEEPHRWLSTGPEDERAGEIQTEVEHGLLDELRLWIHPFLVGKGGPADLLYRD